MAKTLKVVNENENSGILSLLAGRGNGMFVTIDMGKLARTEDVDTLKSLVSQLQTAVKTLQDTVSTLQTTTEELQTVITSLAEQVDQNTSDIQEIKKIIEDGGELTLI